MHALRTFDGTMIVGALLESGQIGSLTVIREGPYTDVVLDLGDSSPELQGGELIFVGANGHHYSTDEVL